MAEFDKAANGGNGDGEITQADVVFSSLRLWQDYNHNGISETAELPPLFSLNAASIDLEYKVSKRTDRHGKRGSTVIDLDLGEGIDNQEVSLHFQGNDEYRMFQRYRTSMSVSAEGPHLDLVDWRHFDSAWTKLKALSSKRFRTLVLNQMDASKFPSTTNDEFVEEIRRRVGTDWPEVLELAQDCDGPNDGACLVLISSIYLRIQKRVHTQWVDVGLIQIRQPMAC